MNSISQSVLVMDWLMKSEGSMIRTL